MSLRTIEFLERTAKSMPNTDIKHCGVTVCYISMYDEYSYFELFPGGANRKVSREHCSELFTRNQIQAAKSA